MKNHKITVRAVNLYRSFTMGMIAEFTNEIKNTIWDKCQIQAHDEITKEEESAEFLQKLIKNINSARLNNQLSTPEIGVLDHALEIIDGRNYDD